MTTAERVRAAMDEAVKSKGGNEKVRAALIALDLDTSEAARLLDDEGRRRFELLSSDEGNAANEAFEAETKFRITGDPRDRASLKAHRSAVVRRRIYLEAIRKEPGGERVQELTVRALERCLMREGLDV